MCLILDAASEVVLSKDVVLVTLWGQRDADSVFLGHEIGRREFGFSVRSLTKSNFEFSTKNVHKFVQKDLVVVEGLPGVIVPLPACGGRRPLEDE